ncbi:MAG: hypothetical protein WDA07_15300 [Leucobacter sp.]
MLVGFTAAPDVSELASAMTGNRHEVRAQIVVLAANSIGTPRLMLMSAQAGHPDGLANSNGLVGTHLTFHSWSFEDFWWHSINSVRSPGMRRDGWNRRGDQHGCGDAR